MKSIHLFATGQKRNGKIARLPDHVRAQINQMLDDGLPYAAIIQRLGEHGVGLSHHNLSRWFRGGYQDHLQFLRDQESARLRRQMVSQAFAQHGLQGIPAIGIARAMDLVLDLDLEKLHPHLVSNADIFTRFVNSMVALANAQTDPPQPSDKPRQIPANHANER